MTCLYTVEIQTSAESSRKILDWNIHRHAPDMLKAGFISTAAYESVDGTPGFTNVYQVPHRDTFLTNDYASMTSMDPYSKNVLGLRETVQQTLFSYHDVAIAENTARPSLVDADFVQMIWFETEAAAQDLAARLRSQVSADLLGQGARALRLAERITNRPGAESNRPSHMLFIEWPELDDTEYAVNLLERSMELSVAADWAGRRLYPWPNRGLSAAS